MARLYFEGKNCDCLIAKKGRDFRFSAPVSVGAVCGLGMNVTVLLVSRDRIDRWVRWKTPYYSAT